MGVRLAFLVGIRSVGSRACVGNEKVCIVEVSAGSAGSGVHDLARQKILGGVGLARQKGGQCADRIEYQTA